MPVSQLYWKDILDDSENWKQLEVIVEDDSPTVQLFSGHNMRFSLRNREKTLFWGAIAQDYYGVWFLRNENKWELSEMLISPIRSEEVEQNHHKNTTVRTKQWARFFMKKLMEGDNSFLYSGKWIMTHGTSDYKQRTKQSELIYQIPEAIEMPQLSYIDWGINGSGDLIVLKGMSSPNSGRVKWWRKQARLDSLPPLLVWYIDSLNAYLLIDGHDRLLASQLENKSPEFIVVKSVLEMPVIPSEKVQKSVMKNMERQRKTKRKHKKAMSTEQINRLIIGIHDDRNWQRSITKSRFQSKFEAEWLKQVQEVQKKFNLDESEFESFLRRD